MNIQWEGKKKKVWNKNRIKMREKSFFSFQAHRKIIDL